MKIGSLFAGIGGIDLAFEQAGFEIAWANEIDAAACKTYRHNFPKTKLVEADIRNLDAKALEKVDILTAGFPCQSFSIIAQNPKRLGVKDDRGKLFFEMCRILKDKQPKCFIAENVKGLLTANQKSAFPLILEEFTNSGYDVKYMVLNAANFGVPQKRERVIMVGFRKDLNIDFSFPAQTIKDEKLYEPLKKVIENSVDEKYYFSEKAVAGMMKKREKMNKGRAQDIEKPCNTVGAHLAKVSLNSTDPVLFNGNRYRRFTPREVARIQSFPEQFSLVGTEAAQYRALGNAIPPVMIWYVANKVKNSL